MKKPVTRMHTLLLGALLMICIPIAALAADAATTTATASTWTVAEFIKTAISGVIGGLITSLLAWFTLRQRQHEFEIQTKMQIESLHSDEKKKVCWDFLASVNPSLFIKNQFDPEKMKECTQPLYLYCKENYYSYFKNLIFFIDNSDLQGACALYEYTCKQQMIIRAELKRAEYTQQTENTSNNISYKIESCHRELGDLEKFSTFVEKTMALYHQQYDLAVEAAKKLIWNEPIEKAQPLQLENLPDEDDI